MKKIILASLLSVAAVSAQAHAADFKDKFYGGFNLGLATATGTGFTSSTGFAAGGHVGYAFNRSISAELAFNEIGAGWKYASIADVTSSTFSASLVGFYSVQKDIDLFGKIGVASSKVSVTCQGCGGQAQSKTAPTFGGGVEFGHDNKTSFRFGYDHYDLSAYSGNGANWSGNDYSVAANFKF